MRPVWMLATVFAWTLAAVPAHAAATQSPLSELEKQGESIYRHGTSAKRHPVIAKLNAQTRVSGSAAACAGCHGSDGSGRREGGVAAPDIRWATLSRPGSRDLPAGRNVGPYDEDKLLRAITMGLDSNGQPLAANMPRFELYDEDAKALVAYLKRLHTLRDPGIETDSLRVGAVLPLSGPAAAQGRSLQALLQDRFDLINQRGGIHGRQLRLEAEDAEGGMPGPRVAALADRTLAMVTPYAPKLQTVLLEAARGGAPILAPVAGWEARELEPMFSTLPTSRHVLGSLAAFWLQLPEAQRGSLTVVTGERADAAQLEDALRAALPSAAKLAFVKASQFLAEAAAPGWVLLDTEPGLLARIASRLGGLRLLAASASVAGQPGELMASAERIVVAAPLLPPRDEGAVREADQWLERKGLSPLPAVVTIQALRGVAMLEEALRAAGRELSREKLIEAIEAIRGLETAGGPLSFGPRQRNGARGAAVFAMDPASGRLGLLRAWQLAP